MNRHEAVRFLFEIATETKRSFDTPVILMTMKDYAVGIFNSLVAMRTVLLGPVAAPEQVADILSAFHLEWLEAVNDIYAFKKRIRDTPRDLITTAIDFTIECVKTRQHHFQQYINKAWSTMTVEETQLMRDEFKVVIDMQDNLTAVLREKQTTFKTLVDSNEYFNKVSDETDELLNWLDKLYDHLAIQFSSFVGFKYPKLRTELTKTLQNIVNEVRSSSDVEIQKVTRELELKHISLTTPSRLSSSSDDFKQKKIHEKIKRLEGRIDRLRNENSLAVIALQHKTVYLQERLRSMENLKMSLYALKNRRKDDKNMSIYNETDMHIFEHLLPAEDRCRLVDDLTKLWTTATFGCQERQSIISILSVTDFKDIFSDESGNVTVDKYGRKLYKYDDDDNYYQLNEHNKLVPLNDDDHHVYFYDDCGRYFLNQSKNRIYKAHKNASEYFMNREGLMLKLKESRDGIEYWYDHLGRYFINEDGNKIYCDANDEDYYENDGLGNLIRLRNLESFKACYPKEPMVSEASKYLQQTVGAALKKCLAAVVLRQPADPIQFLALSLERYRRSEQECCLRHADEAAMADEREHSMSEYYQASTATASSYSSATEIPYGAEDVENLGEGPWGAQRRKVLGIPML